MYFPNFATAEQCESMVDIAKAANHQSWHCAREKQRRIPRELEQESHAYNKGKTLVISKVPLPDYRADLDECHGSTQKEIRMSTDIERRVGNLLNNSQSAGEAYASLPFSTNLEQQSLTATKSVSSRQNDSSKDKLNVALKEKQEHMQASDGLKEMKAFRQRLPAFKMKS